MSELVNMKNGKIEQFYERETGRSAKQGAGRIEKIRKYLEVNNLTLDQVILEKHNDYKWNARRNRTELESQAEVIGSTNDSLKGFLKEMWWIMPKNNK